jgi:hypothetical protein
MQGGPLYFVVVVHNLQEPIKADIGGRFYVFIFIAIWSEMLN